MNLPLPAVVMILTGPFWLAAQTQRHSETITTPRHAYSVRLGGTVDGAMTRDPVVYEAPRQGFDPMRSVRIENTGETDVVNPWITVNGKRDWRTTEKIAQEAMRTYGDPERMPQGEKARAIWEFLRRNRFHATTGDFEVRDPVKMFNVYGFALCGDNAPVLMDLWRAAGLAVRRGFPIGHCVVEAWYDGGWHMLDGDESIIFLDRDNRTIAPEQNVARDHDLAKRAYPGATLGAMYTHDGTRTGDYPPHVEHRMEFTLRPGEAIEWRWGQGSKLHYAPNPTLFTLASADLHQWKRGWATLRNGRWTYTPRLAKGAPLEWKIRTPYVLVGGRLKARVRGGQCAFSVSWDGREWREAARGTGAVEAGLDAFFPAPGEARYEYSVRAEPRGAATLDGITIENDLQMAPLAMPSLELGVNRIVYTDETKGPRSVRANFEWEENSSLVPPEPPAAPVFPADGAEVEGTRITFQWRETPGAADYHFILSDEPGLRWPLSPGFEAQLSEAKQKQLNTFALISDGLLTPGRRYYWHVRAKSAQGVWGPWSAAWSFVAQGPGTPVNVRMEQRDPEAFTLAWDAAPEGRRPVRYRIYGSDEKGFTASDEPQAVFTGNQKARGLFPGKERTVLPASFLAETAEPFYRLKPARAFYRVVAVDERGNRSGSSDFAEAPRPWIYTEPGRQARVGVPYRYETKTIRSIGDLGFRDFGPGQSYQSAYWDADRPRFSLEPELPRCGNFDPAWLRIDPETGVLSGTPTESGEHQVNIRVEIGGRAHIQSFPLKAVR